jgi:cysteine desulfurase family protein (TIGR01976 family)
MDIQKIRSEFPSLEMRTEERPTIFFDNAAGTQVPRRCIDRVNEYYLTMNANTGGVFGTSIRSDALLEECRRAVADLLGAPDREEVAFGANMTTLTQSFARAFGRSLKEGDEIVTTRLEHEANVSPWLALEERGVRVRFADIRLEDATIDLDSLRDQISSRTRLVAAGYASNAMGTINPVAKIAKMAREAGALSFVDAVHYAPHGPIDVEAIGCDVLACSAYKFFGPHIGIIWGRREVMEKIETYHLRTVRPIIPDKFEAGTQNHEGIAGTLGAIEYLEGLAPTGSTRRERLGAALSTIKEYERSLSIRMLELFSELPHVRVYGITDRGRLDERAPTFAVTVDGYRPREVAEHLASRGINVWAGNYYALEPMMRLGLEDRGGAVRISLVHYNTVEEISILGEALAALKK